MKKIKEPLTDKEFYSRYNGNKSMVTRFKDHMASVGISNVADYHAWLLTRKSKLKTEMLRRALTVLGYDVPYNCTRCGWGERNEYSNSVPVEFNHIDGNNKNNDPSNVEVLCPNCHSLEPTSKGSNKRLNREKREMI